MESGRLNQEERYLIHVYRHAGLSMRGIARMIGRAPSTISRELRRNGSELRDDPQHAHRKSRQRRSRASQRPRIDSACIARIEALLAEDLSP